MLSAHLLEPGDVMRGPVCIITPSGMICESAKSYEGHGLTPSQRKTKVPRGWNDRVNTLMKLAKADDAPLMIIERPARRPRR